MRPYLPFCLLLCAFHPGGGSCGNGCAHTGSMGHWGGGHYGGAAPSTGGSHAFSYASLGASPAAVHAPAPSAVRGLDLHLREAIDATADILWSTGEVLGEAIVDGVGSGIEPSHPAPGLDGMCRSVADCGDGALGHGAVCDRTFRGGDPDAVGVCREACRDDRDCPPLMRCQAALDPQDKTWSGCTP